MPYGDQHGHPGCHGCQICFGNDPVIAEQLLNIEGPPPPDVMHYRDDLSDLKTIGDIMDEVAKLRQGIRKHRDAQGHDRCQENNADLYALLPEGGTFNPSLPPKTEFLEKCGQYYDEEARTRLSTEPNRSSPK